MDPGGEASCRGRHSSLLKSCSPGRIRPSRCATPENALWRVKWGAESQARRPSASASQRACGYFAEVTHYVASGRIDGVNTAHRARSLVAEDGRFTDARFELEDRPRAHALRGAQLGVE